MTLYELNRIKPIDEDRLIDVSISLKDFMKYIPETEYYKEVDYGRIVLQDKEYVYEVCCRIFVKCKVLQYAYKYIIRGYFRDIKKYFDLQTLDVIEETEESILTEYNPNNISRSKGPRMPYRDETERD